MPVYALLILCVLFWSGNFVLGRYIHDDIDPLQLALFRWLGVAVLIMPILIKRYKNILNSLKKDFIILSVLSLLGITGFNTILYVGLRDTTATNALLINSSVPVLILVLSYFILKSPIVFRQFIGIMLSTVGVVYLVVKGDLYSLSYVEFNQGDIWVIISSITWALYSVLVRFKPKELNDFEFFTAIVYLGLLWLIIIYSIFGYSFIQDIVLIKKYYPIFIYVALFASVLSYYFWHQGLHKVGANKTGQFVHLMPLFGAILAYIFLGEQIYFYHIVGAVFIAAGIYLSLFSAVHK